MLLVACYEEANTETSEDALDKNPWTRLQASPAVYLMCLLAFIGFTIAVIIGAQSHKVFARIISLKKK